MIVAEDYSWLAEENERSPGMHDYIQCALKIQAMHDEALKLIANAAKRKKKPTIITIDSSRLQETGLMMPLIDASVLGLGPEQLRDRFSIVIDCFAEFDQEREKMMSTKTSLAEGLVWGFWRQGDGTMCGLPEATEFDVQLYPTTEGVPNYGTRQGYEGETPVVEWGLRSFEQTGVTYFVGAASFAEIDAVSRVPSYPNSISDEKWAERALDSETEDDQFQRPLDLSRMQDIQAFVRPIANRILNSVILFIPPESVEGEDAPVMLVDEGEGAARLTVDVGRFVQRHDDGVRRSWGHKSPHRDLRPIMLIDGQHRTRGGAISPEGKDKRVPIVILPSEIGLAEVARIFTEINTGSEPLQKLLQLHLRHRFALASGKEDKDFRHWEELEQDDRRRPRCRANRMSYELAARCCSDEEGAIHRRIRMMDVGSGGTNVATNAQEFVGLAHKWFMPNGPFGAEETDLDFSHRVVSDYLRAWQMVADHEADGMDPWPDPETNRWYPQAQKGGTSGKPKSPYITMQIPFKAVLMTFPLAYELAIARESSRSEPALDDFIEVLRPLQALDWSQTDRIKQAYGTDKHTHFDLYSWFSWALQDYSKNGVTHPPDKVWNPEDPRPEDCMPGRGFFSAASPGLVQIHASIETGDLWPTGGDSLHFWSPLVPNACRAVQWQLNVGGEATPAQTKPVFGDGSMHTIGITVDLAQASSFTVDVFWSRSQSGRLPDAAKATLKIAKDDAGYVSVIGADDKPIERSEPPENIDELEALDEGEYVITTDYGEGAIMPPPPPNQLREATGESMAPARFRLPYCRACFFGFPDCKAQRCAVRDRGIPEA